MSIADMIIARAKRTPYRKGHIFGADGSLYMERYALFETDRLSARLHYIARPDQDRVLHDHPWNFLSVVLKGGYVEWTPIDPMHPTFDGEIELITRNERTSGSVAFRAATYRHRIGEVQPNTWTLFVYGRVAHWWGFYTPAGKIYWLDYLKQQGLA